MKIIYKLLVALSLSWAAFAIAEGTEDTTQEKQAPTSQSKLHETNCIECHATMFNGKSNMMYTRKDRKVKTAEGLRSRVQMCASNLNLQWFDEDIEEVTNFLNKEFYHFKAETVQ